MGRKGFYPSSVKKHGKDTVVKKTLLFFSLYLLFKVNTVMATTNDDLYVKTFNAVAKCSSEISQQNIKLARNLLAEMSKVPSLKFAIGEFSKKVDESQQKLFDEFYSYMYENGSKEKPLISQNDINKARQCLEEFAIYKENNKYISCWSSKLDEFQGKIIVKANVSVENYKKSPIDENYVEAKKWVEELSLSTNEDCKKEANRLKKIIVTHNGSNDTIQLPLGMTSFLEKEIQQEKDIYGKTVFNEEEMKIAVRGALRNFEDELKIKGYNLKETNMGDVINEVLDFAPEIDYGYKGGSYSVRDENDGGKTITIKFRYSYDKCKLIEQRDKVYDKINEIISENIYSYMTKFDIELLFHDYLVENTEYNEYYINQGVNHPEDHNAYGVLIEKLGVCEGYAKAMCILSKAVGLECIYVKGITNGPHGWNMVKLDDGKWYIVDITWDDPVYRNEYSRFMKISYKYFNMPEEEFKKDHTSDSDVPKADGVKYLRDNVKLDEKDIYGKVVNSISSKDELRNIIRDSIISKRPYIVGNFKNMTMTSKEIFDTIKSVNMELKVSMSYNIIYDGTPMKYFKLSFEYK